MKKIFFVIGVSLILFVLFAIVTAIMAIAGSDIILSRLPGFLVTWVVALALLAIDETAEFIIVSRRYGSVKAFFQSVFPEIKNGVYRAPTWTDKEGGEM
jgi:hypothetical protein